MRTVFMGSPAFAVPSLCALAEATEVVGVVCQPDKPSGRGLGMSPPEVKVKALELGLPVMQPAFLRPSKSSFLEELKALAPELIVVVAYGKILPPEVLAVPRFGCWNVHGSILPRYRGAAPIQWALLRGETVTGITLMQMDAGMDTGPMLKKREMPIGDDDTGGTLHDQLSQLGADLLAEGLRELLAGNPPAPTPQDDALATMAPKLDKEHGRVDFTRPAAAVSAQMRAVDPWPGAFTTLPAGFGGAPGEVLTMKLFAPRASSGKGAPGEVLGVDKNGLHVACGDGAVAIAELQLPGRKRMTAAALCSGLPLPRGLILGQGKPNPLLG
jgi:methionyl-tRNA formyltransferase